MTAPSRSYLNKLGPIPNEVITELRNLGHLVEVAFIEDHTLSLPVKLCNFDLYVLKAHDDYWLSIASLLEKQGSSVINNCAACIDSENKIIATSTLLSAGIRVPNSWLVASISQLRSPKS